MRLVFVTENEIVINEIYWRQSMEEILFVIYLVTGSKRSRIYWNTIIPAAMSFIQMQF